MHMQQNISQHNTARHHPTLLLTFVYHLYFLAGSVFGFDVPRFQTYLDGHGSVEFELQCHAIMPMYRQCVSKYLPSHLNQR